MSKRGVSPGGMGAPKREAMMGVEARGEGSEIIHLRQSKGDARLHTGQGSSRQDSRAAAVCKETVGGGYFKGGRRGMATHAILSG